MAVLYCAFLVVVGIRMEWIRPIAALLLRARRWGFVFERARTGDLRLKNGHFNLSST